MADDFDYESFLNILPPIPRGPPPTPEQLQKTPEIVFPPEALAQVGGGKSTKKLEDAVKDFVEAYNSKRATDLSALRQQILEQLDKLVR